MVYSTVSGALQLMNAAESGTHPELSPFSCRWVTGDRVSAHHKQQPLASSSSSVHATQELSTEDITSMRQKASTPTLAVPPTSRDSAAEIPIPTVSMLSRYLSSSQLSLPFHELEAGILAQMRDIQSGNL
ncbi:hypothetical protein EV182_005295 [Spiromyces aspiralis]|uniref:Uncharacterized protein n=1 Tax=Spiromyces aspiralis TaxID=68401 RepID=A0ACC1HN38_9FUNG|nr:hypothetical protein EV182_005295 [Spiromyces aspiralis]